MPTPLTFVCWKWRGPDPARQFPSHAVNVLYAMLARHFHALFRLVCLTDDPAGLDPSVEYWPLPETKADGLESPRHTSSKIFPACYRRLWLFSEEAQLLGERVCQIDIDVVIVEDITTLIQNKTADFVGWSGDQSWNKIAGGLWLLTTGKRCDVWRDFDPVTSPALAHAAGHRGSDQAWLSYKLWPPRERWTERDGVIKINQLRKGGQSPPRGTKLVFTTGTQPPWSQECELGHTWVREHWHL